MCGSNSDFVVVPSGVSGCVSDVKTELTDITTETKTQAVLVECCFTSTETVGLFRDGEPRTATSTLTQLLSSEGGVMMMMWSLMSSDVG